MHNFDRAIIAKSDTLGTVELRGFDSSGVICLPLNKNLWDRAGNGRLTPVYFHYDMRQARFRALKIDRIANAPAPTGGFWGWYLPILAANLIEGKSTPDDIVKDGKLRKVRFPKIIRTRLGGYQAITDESRDTLWYWTICYIERTQKVELIGSKADRI